MVKDLCDLGARAILFVIKVWVSILLIGFLMTQARADAPKQACVIVYAGLGSSGIAPSTRQLSADLNSMPHVRSVVLEHWMAGKFESDCRVRVVIGHSLGVGSALAHTQREHVDLLVSYDGMGFDTSMKSRASHNLCFVLDQGAANWYKPWSLRWRHFPVVTSSYSHIFVTADPKLKRIVMHAIGRLQ